MQIALLITNEPKRIKQSHPSLLGPGEWRVNVRGAQSLISVHVHSPDGEEQTKCRPEEVFKGPARVVLHIENVHLDDKRIVAYAERI